MIDNCEVVSSLAEVPFDYYWLRESLPLNISPPHGGIIKFVECEISVWYEIDAMLHLRNDDL